MSEKETGEDGVTLEAQGETGQIGETKEFAPVRPTPPFDPTEGLKQLFRDQAKKDAAAKGPPVPVREEAPPAPAKPAVREAASLAPAAEDIAVRIEGMLTPPADVGPAPRSAAPAGEPSEADDLKDAPPEVQQQGKARSAWTGIKREKRELAAKVQQLEKQLAEVKTAPPPGLEELATLKQTVQDQDARLAQLDLAQSAGFKQRYDQPLNDRFHRGVQILLKAGKTEADARQVMLGLVDPANDVSAIQDLLGGEPPVLQSALTTLAFEAIDLQQQRQQAITDWQATRATLAETGQRVLTADLAQAIVSDTSFGMQSLEQENSWLFAESKVSPEWNQQRDAMVQTARGILRDGKPEEIAKFVLEGVAAAKYRKWGEALNDQLTKLREETQSRASRVPGLGGGNADPPPATPPVTDDRTKPQNPDEWLRKNVTRANVTMRR